MHCPALPVAWRESLLLDPAGESGVTEAARRQLVRFDHLEDVGPGRCSPAIAIVARLEGA
jgi:hypothetical protein